LLFIRASDNLVPLCPKSTSTFSAATASTVAPPSGSPYARVWYGHLLRTKPDGSSDSGAILGDTKNGSANRLGINWILGRQAMLLADQLNTLSASTICVNDGNGHSDPQGNAYGHGGGELDTGNTILGYAGSHKLYEGLSDVAEGGLPTIRDNKKENGSSGSNGNGNGGRWGANRKAKKWKVEALATTFSTERLRVNPTPSAASLTSNSSERIAQMHAYMMSNVSDFIVEFAGDYASPTGIDTDASGNIIWYGLGATDLLDNDNTNDEPDPFYEALSTSNADKAYYFRNGASKYVTSSLATVTNWPYLIRIRYRLHDRKGGFASSSDGATGMWFEQIIKVPRDQ